MVCLAQGEGPMASNHVLALVFAVWPEVTAVLNRLWETPAVMSRTISTLLQSSAHWAEVRPEVTVAGSPDQHILCLAGDDQLVLCSPRGHLIAHPFVRELAEEFDVGFEEHTLETAGDCLTTPLPERLKTRLALPSVLLVSLFHPEMYPATRLTLGISYLASYLRLHHLAHVELMDCQLSVNVDDVLTSVRQSQPAILGVSVNFG